jgi:hypothetical protein
VDTQLDAHATKQLYSGNSIDNQTVGGRLVLGHRSGPRSNLGVGASIDDVSYLGGSASSLFDFQRREAFLHGDLRGIRTELTAELGYAEAVGDTVDSNGPLARIQLTHKMSSALEAYLGYRHEYPTSQAALSVSDPTPGGGGILNTSLVTSSPRESWTGEVGFRYKKTRSEGEIGFYHLDEQSLVIGLGDHTYDELRARVVRNLTPRSKGSIYAAYSREDFSAFNQGSDDLHTGVEYAYSFTRSIGIEARLEYQTRNSHGSTFSYNEFNGGVFLTYSGSLLGRSVATPRNPNAPTTR